MKYMCKLVVIALAGGAMLSAADPRIGTWKVVSFRSLPLSKITITAQGNSLHLDRSPTSGVEFTAEVDGKDAPVLNSPVADHVALHRIDVHTIERIFKKADQIVNTVTFNVTPDANELRVTTGPGVTQIYVRSGGAKVAENPFVGEWTFDRGTQNRTFVFEPSGEDGVKFSSSGYGYTAKLDGKQYPAKDPTDDAVSVKVIDAHHVLETWFRGGKVTGSTQWLISADGRETQLTTDAVRANGTKVHSEMRLRRE
jgi:hypothetical protein